MTSLDAVTDVARRTSALRPMVVHLTGFIAGASGSGLARILASRINARLVQRTIRVTATTNDHAGRLWIARVARFALAHCPVIDAVAVAVSGAGVLLAHWHALSVDARVLA